MASPLGSDNTAIHNTTVTHAHMDGQGAANGLMHHNEDGK